MCIVMFPQGILIGGPVMIVGGLVCWGGVLLFCGEGGWWEILVLLAVALIVLIGLSTISW